MTLSLAFVLVTSLLAFALSTVSGGGAGLLLLPALASVLPGLAVPAALTVGTAASTVSKAALFRRFVRWDITRLFVPGAVPGVLLGVAALKRVNPLYLEIFIGLFLLSNIPLMFRKSVVSGEAPPPGARWRVVLIGFVAGFLSGLTGAVGLIFNRFYFRYGLTRDEVIATRAANELLLHLLKLVLYLTLGLLTRRAWLVGITVAVGAVAATVASKRFVRFLPEDIFRRVGYGAMAVSGCLLLASAGRSLVETKNLGLRVALLGGGDGEISGFWTGGSVALEWEYDEGLAVESQIPYADLPPDVRARVEALRAGRPLLKVEEVWQWGERYYEVYLDDGGKSSMVEFPRS